MIQQYLINDKFDEPNLTGEKAALRSIVESESHGNIEDCIAQYRGLMPLKSSALQKFVDARLLRLEQDG